MSLNADIPAHITIVVLEIAGGKALADCLFTVQRFKTECIAVLKKPVPDITSNFAHVKCLIVDEPVPLRRLKGVYASSGEIVVLVEDTTIPGPLLLDGLARIFNDKNTLAASGPISIGNDLPERYQALACTEYGRYHANVIFTDNSSEFVPVERLPGNFICYRRDALMQVLARMPNGLIEGEVNQYLISAGATLMMDTQLASTYCGEDQWGALLATRFQHGRLYAGALVEEKNITGRFIQFLKSLVLPAVLATRAIGFLSRMNGIKRPIRVCIWIFLMEFCWSVGEVVGTLAGAPETMEHWR